MPAFLKICYKKTKVHATKTLLLNLFLFPINDFLYPILLSTVLIDFAVNEAIFNIEDTIRRTKLY